MKTIHGSIQLPADAPELPLKHLILELRDVSEADAPSTVVAKWARDNVTLEPNGRVPFQIDVPEIDEHRSLSFRVHGSRDGSDEVKAGDLITTTSNPLTQAAAETPLTLRVKVI